MSDNPLNRIAQGKLRPVNEAARKVLSKGSNRNGSAAVKCVFCDEFVASNQMRLHFKEFHPGASRGENTVCSKCGLQIKTTKYLCHTLKCQGDKENAC